MLKRRRTEQDELLVRPETAPPAPARRGTAASAAAPAIERPDAPRRVRKRRGLFPIVARPAAVALLLIAVAYLSLPHLLRAGRMRSLLENQLGRELGRKVHVGSLKFTMGLGLVATNVTVAEDPAFGSAPFVQVREVTLGVGRMAMLFGGALEISSLSLADPSIALIRNVSGRWNFTSILTAGAPAPGPGPEVRISGGVVTLRDGTVAGAVTLRHVSADFPHFSTAAEANFSMGAAVGGGMLNVNGKAGPVIWDRGLPALPMNLLINARKVGLAASGVTSSIAPAVDGALTFDGTLESDGSLLTVAGNAQAAGLKLSRRGTAVPDPVLILLTVTHDLRQNRGDVSRGEIHLGNGIADLRGGYSLSDGRPVVRFTMQGHGVPITPVAPLLESAGIPLPAGTRLQDGVANLDFTLEGPVDHPAVAGTVSLNNTRLMSFDMQERLSSIAGLDTLLIRRDLRMETFTARIATKPDRIEVEDLAIEAPEVGKLRGSGAIFDDRTLDFRMQATPVGAAGRNPIPFVVRGSCESPIFRQPGKM